MAKVKTLTNRLRRVAHRSGFTLIKARTVPQGAPEGAGFMLVQQRSLKVVTGAGYGATLDDIQRALGVDANAR